jgi:hypothetical protein
MPTNRGHQASHVISTSLNASPNIVGVHYRVGKKIGQGSFGVIYEGKFYALALYFANFY